MYHSYLQQWLLTLRERICVTLAVVLHITYCLLSCVFAHSVDAFSLFTDTVMYTGILNWEAMLADLLVKRWALRDTLQGSIILQYAPSCVVRLKDEATPNAKGLCNPLAVFNQKMIFESFVCLVKCHSLSEIAFQQDSFGDVLHVDMSYVLNQTAFHCCLPHALLRHC